MASPSAASSPLASAFRMRSTIASGTGTSAISCSKNSASRAERRGQIVAMAGTLSISGVSSSERSASGSKTGAVIAYSAPASTFQLKREISRSRSKAVASIRTPMWNRVGSPIGLPPMSSPWLRRSARFTRPMESMSRSGSASPAALMGSPVTRSRLWVPVAQAPRRSERICAIRRPRQE
jgi:hypothetical protein